MNTTKRIALIILFALLTLFAVPAMAQDEATSEPTAATVAPIETVAPVEQPAPPPIIINSDGSESVNWSYVINVLLLLYIAFQQFRATGKLDPVEVQKIIDRARVGASATKDNPFDDVAVTIAEAVTKALIAQQAAQKTAGGVSPAG